MKRSEARWLSRVRKRLSSRPIAVPTYGVTKTGESPTWMFAGPLAGGVSGYWYWGRTYEVWACAPAAARARAAASTALLFLFVIRSAPSLSRGHEWRTRPNPRGNRQGPSGIQGELVDVTSCAAWEKSPPSAWA